MKIRIVLNNEKVDEEIITLNDYIKEQNLKGIITNIHYNEPEKGTMGVGEFLPIIELILGSTVVAAGVKGLFDVFKNYFELRKERIISLNDLEKTKFDQNKIELNLEVNEGKKINLKFNSFNENERQLFFESVDQLFKDKV